MVGADGAIHLDQFQQVDVNDPVIIQQTPELIQPSIVEPGGPIPLPSQIVAPDAYGACPPFVPYMPMVGQSVQQQPLPLKFSLFGEFLYLNPRGVDVAHAQQVSGASVLTTSPNGQVGVVDFDYEPGVRIGGDVAVGPTSSLAAAYTWFESDGGSRLSPRETPALFDGVESLVAHPDGLAGASAGPIDARGELNFQLADGQFRTRLHQGPRHWINGGVGLRYARLEQEFNQTIPFGMAGNIDAHVDADFDGGGPLLQLDGGRNIGNRGFSLYARSSLSPLAGEFRSSYWMFSDDANQRLVQVDWRNDRIMTILDYEAGLAWSGPRKRWRFSAGYLQSIWFNAVTPGAFIPAVQSSDYHDVSDTIMFDGLTARVEHLW